MSDDRRLIEKGLMLQADYEQEWYLSSSAAIRGAWWGAELGQCDTEGRITGVPYDPGLPVDTTWDLGVDDATSIWFSQSTRGGEIRLIDYYEASGEGLPHFIKKVKDKSYVWGTHWAPHDINVRELGTGKSRLETAKALGLKFQTVPSIPFIDGIQAVRLLLQNCWFDETKAGPGLNALRNYRKTWNSRINEFTAQPIHDWASHGADAFRYLAVRHKTPVDKQQKRGGKAAFAIGERAWLG